MAGGGVLRGLWARRSHLCVSTAGGRVSLDPSRLAPFSSTSSSAQTLVHRTREAGIDVFGGAEVSPQAAETFCAWHSAVSAPPHHRAAAIEQLRPHLHEQCVFKPPTYFRPWLGREEMLLILECVVDVFGESFAYGRQWLSEDGHQWALEFKAEIADTGKKLEGIDLISLDRDGKLVELTVLARPPNAVEELKKQMLKRVPARMLALKARQALGYA